MTCCCAGHTCSVCARKEWQGGGQTVFTFKTSDSPAINVKTRCF
jgi:hypothetical protein